jgi:hypothetical protein
MYLATVDWGDLDPKHQQFAIYPRRSPQWVLLAHPSDKVTDLAVDLGAATMSTRLFPVSTSWTERGD